MKAVHINPTIEIAMIGRSKGGAEVANSVAMSANAIIFNPTTANLFVYESDSNAYIADMIAYVVERDALNTVLGGVYTYWRVNHVR